MQRLQACGCADEQCSRPPSTSKHCSGDVALCDQDNFWRTDRLKTGLALLQEAATSFLNGTKQPLLLNSNAELIDGNGIIVQGAYGPDNAALTTRINGIGPKQHRQGLHDACYPRNIKLYTSKFRGHYSTKYSLALVARHNDGFLNFPQQLITYRRHARNSRGLTSHSKQALGHAFEHHLKKHRQWTSFCDRYQINLQTRLQWWPRSVFHFYK